MTAGETARLTTRHTMAFYNTNSFKKLITRHNQEEWLQRAIKACNGNKALFQKIIRIIWWDAIQFIDGDLLKAEIDYRFYDVDISEKQVAAALKRAGYPAQIALQRSHNPEQKKSLMGGPRGRPRKPPEDEK